VRLPQRVGRDPAHHRVALLRRVSDGTADAEPATVSVTVTAVNDSPTVAVAPGGARGADDRSGTLKLTVVDRDHSAGEPDAHGRLL
jgi:hypothetical protein